MSFREYLTHGWKLCNIQRGFKGPIGAAAKGWNLREKAISDPALGPQMASAGLLHAYSGTCAFDIDNYAVAHEWLAKRGVDLDALFADPRAVQISSGRPGRGKLLYALATPLASKKFAPYTAASPKTGKPEQYHGFELRCANSEGLSVQDVLPPSIHPDTGRPYEWRYDELAGHWSMLPELPETLRDIWLAELQPAAPVASAPSPQPTQTASTAEIRDMLEQWDPDADYDTWLKVGLAIHNGTRASAEGFALWNEWSSKGGKYKGGHDLEPHWRSFKLDVNNPVTLGMLRQTQIAKPEAFSLVEPTQAPASSNRFRPIPADEFMNRPPPTFIVDNVLPRAEIGAIFGESQSGKTFLALDLAGAVARGVQWRDKKVKQGRVVYLAAEDANGVSLRMRAYRQQYGSCPIEVIPNSPNFCERNDIVELVQALQVGGPLALLFVDTLTNATPGADEHTKEMAPAFEHAKTISKVTGALVVFIHHSGKDKSKGMRGWSGMLGYLDVAIEVNRLENARTAIVTKAKNFQDGEAFPFRLNRVELGAFEERQVSSCIVEHTEAPAPRTAADRDAISPNEQLAIDAVRDLMTDNGVTVDMVCSAMRSRSASNVRRTIAERTLNKLATKGLLQIQDQIVTFPDVVA